MMLHSTSIQKLNGFNCVVKGKGKCERTICPGFKFQRVFPVKWGPKNEKGNFSSS
jgi:hypothetical protein